MITLNSKEIKIEHFPDGSQRLKLNIEESTQNFLIKWFYTSDEELFTLICIKKHIDNIKNKDISVNLFLPYLVNARMDRVKNEDEVFTLKYFCEVINDLKFNSVTILDPHSNVAPALLDRIKVVTSESYVKQAIEEIEDKENLILFTPDEGAMKRYSEYEMFKIYPSTFGMKNRDWKTGKILSYDILHPEVVRDKDVLIIDDICSYGGTFYHAAKALKAAGARSVSLFVTHMEKSVFNGDMYKEDIMKNIYTTDSLFREEWKTPYSKDIKVFKTDF